MVKIKDLYWLFKLTLRIIKTKALLFLGKEENNPYRLLIKINSNCNYQCLTCGNWKVKKNTFISTESSKKTLSHLKGNLFFLSITGGEPLLEMKKLFKFIKTAISLNPNLRHISLNTNCSSPLVVYKFSYLLLKKFPDISLKIGLHHIPNKKWGAERTGIKSAYYNYKKTKKACLVLEKKFKNRLSFYKMITISKKEDIRFIKKEDNLWLNFATVNHFYENTDNNYIENITKNDKIKIINEFLSINKGNIDIVNKAYIFNLKKIIIRGRKRKCYAGINRIYSNEEGELFICSMGVKKRSAISTSSCQNCWTACEANFDLLADFFMPTFFNKHQKDISKNKKV